MLQPAPESHSGSEGFFNSPPRRGHCAAESAECTMVSPAAPTAGLEHRSDAARRSDQTPNNVIAIPRTEEFSWLPLDIPMEYDDNHHMEQQRTTGSKGSETRERILRAAASRFRRQGYMETSVNQVMRDAGLTHGGFYAHFPSKEDLFAEAVRHATDESGDRLESQIEDLKGAAWVDAWVDAYLSDAHCKQSERGCPIPSLMPEVARAGSGACDAFATGFGRRLDRLCHRLPFARGESERRAMSAYAHMAGAVMLSRTLDPESSARLRRDVARAVKELLLGRREVTQPSTTGEGS